jgi:hypothetical protein
MGNPVPTQIRTVDPYSSFESDNVNKINRMITSGDDCLVYPNLPYVEIITSNTIKVHGGNYVKDDVLIETEDLAIDMNDGDYYLTGSAWASSGTYYVVLKYTYQITSPVPSAQIQIIHPSGRAAFDADPSPYVFINALTVDTTSGLEVTAILSTDPDYPTTAKRTIRGGGAGVVNTEIYTSSTTATGDEDTILVSNNTTITLPLASSSDKRLTIINTDGNTTTINRAGSDTIDGATSVVMNTQYSTIVLLPEGTTWHEV